MLAIPAIFLPAVLHICVMSAPILLVMLTPLIGFQTTTRLPLLWIYEMMVCRKWGYVICCSSAPIWI